jgi:hypothetical protein
LKDSADYEQAQHQKHPDAGNYRYFSDIPEHLVCESFLVAWLLQGTRFADIPKEHWTERVVWAGMRNDSFAFDVIKPDDVSDYRALLLEWIRFGPGSFNSLPPEYRTEQFVIDLGAQSPIPMDLTFLSSYPHLITPRVADELGTKSFDHAFVFWRKTGEIGQSLMSDAHFERAIRNDSSHLEMLAFLNREHILIDMVSRGYWPSETKPNRPATVERPENLAGLPQLLRTNMLEGHKFLYRCWIKTRPVDEVVDAYHGYKAGIDELFCLYDEKVLKGYANQYRSLRGRFLEHDLGM